MWITKDHVSSTVLIGNSSHNYSMTFKGNATTYMADDMCADMANITSEKLFRDPGYVGKFAKLLKIIF